MIPVGKRRPAQAQTDTGTAIGGVVYSSSDTSIASIFAEDGTNAWILGVSPGTVTITATPVGHEDDFSIDPFEVVVTAVEDPEEPGPVHGQIVWIGEPV